MIEPAITKITLSKQQDPSQTHAIKGPSQPIGDSSQKGLSQAQAGKIVSEPNGEPLLQYFGIEPNATRVAQRDGPSDDHRGGGRGGGRGKVNRGGRGNPGGRSNRGGRGEVSQAEKKQISVGAHGTVAKNRTSLDPSVNIGCAKLLSHTAYGAYPQVQAFQNSVAFVSAAFGGSGFQVNGTWFAPIHESNPRKVSGCRQ